MAADKYLNLEGLERVAGYVLKVVTSIPVNPNNEDIVLYKNIFMPSVHLLSGL